MMTSTTSWPVWLLLGLGTLGFWGAVAYAAGSLVARSGSAVQDGDNPLATLDEQLGRGQISVDDYAQERRRLADGH